MDKIPRFATIKYQNQQELQQGEKDKEQSNHITIEEVENVLRKLKKGKGTWTGQNCSRYDKEDGCKW